MAQYVYWMGSLITLEDWNFVLMEYGVECVITSDTGVLTMPELCAVNWDTLKKVSLCWRLYYLFILPPNTEAYNLYYDPRFGSSKESAVIGEVNCVGTEPELLECSHSSIGNHNCLRSNAETDIVISCFGAYTLLFT